MKLIVKSLSLLLLSLPIAQSKDLSKLNNVETLITYVSTSKSESSDGGNSESNSRGELIERIIGKRDEALVVEYTFPASYEANYEIWKLPARVLFESGVPIEIDNRSEIEERLKKYIDQNPEFAELCGQTIFTWTIVSIDCSVDGILNIVNTYNLNVGDLTVGKSYSEIGSLIPVRLTAISSSSEREIYNAKLLLDPKYLRSSYEAEIRIVAKILGQDYDNLLKSSLNLTDGEIPIFSGTRNVSLETSSTGKVLSIRRETTIEIRGGSNFTETRSLIEKLERQEVQ